MCNSRSKKAFTLIELLVVIAIIAILAAILFPVFAQAKEAAKKATCTSQAKQIGLANLMYATDYDGTYPPSSTPVFIPNPDGTRRYEARMWWGGFVYDPFPENQVWDPTIGFYWPYMKNRQINDCPTAKDNGMQPTPGYVNGIGVNMRVIVAASATRVNESSIEAAAETILLGDNAGVHTPGGHLYQDPSIRPPSAPRAGLARLAARHNRKATITWVDGHVTSRSVHVPGVEWFSGSNPVGHHALAVRYQVGDLLHPSYPLDGCAARYDGNFCKVDYYYNLTKPQD
jgi:prepilin-type N-terminal cleavage/methylation domain-containing protein/prepilin-type processing-associated H-X9-DG protein